MSHSLSYTTFPKLLSAVALDSLTVRHGHCNGSCSVLGSIGGGIYNTGTLAINNSLVTENTTPAGGSGAGLYNDGGTVAISASTFSNNISYNAAGAIVNANGPMSISNTTITNNRATDNVAGGIYNIGTLDIYNSTISGNISNSSINEGDNIYQDSGDLSLYNTIIANSTTHGDCVIGGGTVKATYSLIESTGTNACGLTNGSKGNIIGSVPNLGSLTGSPAYFPLNTGSPAIDAGDDTICATTPISNTSQNGVTRPQGAHCDIGSFELPVYGPTSLVNSVLPTSRTPVVGNMVTIFNTVINAGADTASGITLSMNPAPPGTFVYQQTNCATNAIIGSPNPSLNLAAGGVLCYVLSFTPSATFAATSVHIRAQAANAPSTNLLTGINTWLLRSTAAAGPDIIALTTTVDFHQVACSGADAFAVALSNVGVAATGDITAVANTGSASLPLNISISETNPGTGVIIGDNILQSVGAGDNRTVAVFVTYSGCVSFDPAVNRIFIEFRDASNNVIGSTSTAVSTNR